MNRGITICNLCGDKVGQKSRIEIVLNFFKSRQNK